ncbi:MAG: DUF2158 domain-containing protein [Verrucomicrobiota bacterium]
MFQVGQTVQLKSGGPTMTVVQVLRGDENPLDEGIAYRAHWTENDAIKDGVFAEASLEKIVPTV